MNTARTGRLLGMLWIATLVPLLVLPVVFIAGVFPPSRVLSHATFHIIYQPVIIVAGVLAGRLARTAPRRPVRVAGWLVVALQAVAFVGHAGELWVVMGNGGFDAPESVFALPAHALFGDFTPLALLAAVVVVLVATVVWAVGRRRTHRDEFAPA